MAKPKVATQGEALNYLGKQPTVSGVPKKWKSSLDHPATELAYITKKEKDVLIDLDLHNSLKGKANKGPGGLPSLNGFAEGADAAGRGGFNAPAGQQGPASAHAVRDSEGDPVSWGGGPTKGGGYVTSSRSMAAAKAEQEQQKAIQTQAISNLRSKAPPPKRATYQPSMTAINAEIGNMRSKLGQLAAMEDKSISNQIFFFVKRPCAIHIHHLFHIHYN